MNNPASYLIKSALPLIAVVFLSACVSALTNQIATVVNISEPLLGSISTASVGECILRQGTFVERKALLVTMASSKQSLNYSGRTGNKVNIG